VCVWSSNCGGVSDLEETKCWKLLLLCNLYLRDDADDFFFFFFFFVLSAASPSSELILFLFFFMLTTHHDYDDDDIAVATAETFACYYYCLADDACIRGTAPSFSLHHDHHPSLSPPFFPSTRHE
jgi:hypothetical protein